MEMQIENELKKLKIHLNWKKVQNEDGSFTKVPYAFDGTKIGADPKYLDKWCDFATAKVQVEDGTADGVGIALYPLNFNNSETKLALSAIDIDHRDINDLEVQDILSLMNTYAEFSPSGKGLHLLFLVDAKQLSENYREDFYMKNPHNNIEAYVGGMTNRFMTFTENVIADKPICERTQEFMQFLNTYMHRDIDFSKVDEETTTNAPIENNPVPVSNRVIADTILRVSGNDKFDKLYNFGDTSDYNGDDSAADMALAEILAYYVGPNPERIDNLMRQSALYRSKWERKDYREGTIQKAIAFCKGNFFDWRNEDISEENNYAGALETLNADEIMQLDLEPLEPVVEGMLYPGFSIMAGPPKMGKSYACLDLGISVSTGEPFLGFKTNQAEVLYLALEDSIHRLKTRLGQILGYGNPAPKGFHITTSSNTLDDGLLSSLQSTLNKNPKIKLIMIDTLQKVRGAQVRSETWYSGDYREAGKLKKFADINKVCLMVIHHVKKEKDSDPFNTISGSTGLTGAADTMIVFSKLNEDNKDGKLRDAMLDITGRDVKTQELFLSFNNEKYKWEIGGQISDYQNYRDQLEYKKNPIVITIKALLSEEPYKTDGLRLTASELLERIKEMTGVTPRQQSPQVLSREINENLQFQLWDFDKIYYESGKGKRTDIMVEIYISTKVFIVEKLRKEKLN